MQSEEECLQQLRVNAKLMIDLMPDKGLPETVDELRGLLKFYREQQVIDANRPPKQSRVFPAQVVKRTGSKPISFYED